MPTPSRGHPPRGSRVAGDSLVRCSSGKPILAGTGPLLHVQCVLRGAGLLGLGIKGGLARGSTGEGAKSTSGQISTQQTCCRRGNETSVRFQRLGRADGVRTAPTDAYQEALALHPHLSGQCLKQTFEET